ncbi:MAG: glutathione S-transferase [Alphaproteobacteria bacterium]|nr:glutathione S-transferase [Alphaproteobacteria bacterium]
MKLYDFKMAPNPRRAVMFMAEKGLDIPRVSVDLGSRAQLKEDYARVNPMQQVPALELDDGTVITESVAICQYLEELHPEPNLMGRTPLERAQVTMWERRMEQQGLMAVSEAFRNDNPFFEGRSLSGPVDLDQIPALAERGRKRFSHFMRQLDGFLADRPYVAGDRFTFADITGFIVIDFARVIKMRPPEELANLTRWYAEIGSRPSAKA